jgi:hypothetical protein
MQQRQRLSPHLKVYSTRQKAKGKSGRRSPMQLVALRLNDLSRLFRSRYGLEMPDDDAGRDDMRIAIHHLACLPRPRQAIMHWLEVWAPWMPVAEASELAGEAMANPRRYKADALAWCLGLTQEQRTMLGITTIGATDMNKAARTKRRKQLDRERKASQRRANGVKPRKLYEAQSLSRAKPWLTEGISRATWYRRQRETGARDNTAEIAHDTGPATA